MGWLTESEIFLDPGASHQVAEQIAGAEHRCLSVHTLSRRLQQQGLLASVDKATGDASGVLSITSRSCCGMPRNRNRTHQKWRYFQLRVDTVREICQILKKKMIIGVNFSCRWPW